MAMKRNPNWSREEHILAFNLYCKIPFGTIHQNNPKIIELAKILGRSSGSVSYKLANFARLDPSLAERGIKGMSHGAKGEADIWNEFRENGEVLAFESERLLAERLGQPIETLAQLDEADLPKEGVERERVVKQRVNQQFFRCAVLSAYDGRCCVTGIALPTLLVASHIMPWSLDKRNRLNPCNGLCLNALHDQAFDKGLMFITEEQKVSFRKDVVAEAARPESGLDWMLRFEGHRIHPPRKFKPDAALLAKHRKLWKL